MVNIDNKYFISDYSSKENIKTNLVYVMEAPGTTGCIEETLNILHYVKIHQLKKAWQEENFEVEESRIG